MSRRLRRNPRRPSITPRKNRSPRFIGVQLLSIGSKTVLTILSFLCGIFPLPHLTIERRWLLPQGTATIFDVLWTIAVWDRNLNFKKEKNRP